MLDQDVSERVIPQVEMKEPPRIQIGEEINFSKMYSDEKTRNVIFGRSPSKFTPELFKGEHPTYAFLPLDAKISRCQLVIKPSANEIVIQNPTETKNIWVNTGSDEHDKVVLPGQGISLPNNTESMRNLKILFARRHSENSGYQLKATLVSGDSTHALRKLRLERD